MPYRIFTIMAMHPESGEEALNRFLASHAVVDVKREFVAAAEQSYWSFCVRYQAGEEGPPPARKGKIDYREVLNEDDFALYARLRTLRKELADKAGVPVYGLFTNEQLAEMARRRVATPAQLAEISGIGQTRIEKYGDPFLGVIREQSTDSSKPGPGDETDPD